MYVFFLINCSILSVTNDEKCVLQISKINLKNKFNTLEESLCTNGIHSATENEEGRRHQLHFINYVSNNFNKIK